MDIQKLNSAIGKKVFVVSLRMRVMRVSDYGKLEMVNEPNNIILAKMPFGDSIIPLDEILKIYDDEGYVVYDNEPTKKNK